MPRRPLTSTEAALRHAKKEEGRARLKARIEAGFIPVDKPLTAGKARTRYQKCIEAELGQGALFEALVESPPMIPAIFALKERTRHVELQGFSGVTNVAQDLEEAQPGCTAGADTGREARDCFPARDVASAEGRAQDQAD